MGRLKYMEKIIDLVNKHNEWRRSCINLIASENTMSPICEKLYTSDLMHRYAEGLPFQRYYKGLKYVDEIEDLTEKEFKKHFNINFVDIRPTSGTLANYAVFSSLAKPGETIMSLGIDGGSHISHEKGGAIGMLKYEIEHVVYNPENLEIDVQKTGEKILEKKPKFIILGGSVLLFPQPLKEIKEYCSEVQTKMVYDAAHVFGLITCGKFQNPFEEGADIITSSTHKTFPGPQGGIILANLDDEKLKTKIQNRVFPGFVSNHHLHRVPCLYAALREMQEFGEEYTSQILKNSKALALKLNELGFDVIGKSKGYTESHQVLLNVRKQGGGKIVADKLEDQNIILNKNIIPHDNTSDPDNPNGIRIGVQEMTRFGMKEKDMEQVAHFIFNIIIENKDVKNKVIEFRNNFKNIKFVF
ncbi:MAG: serine hydroxymethyltransferase [Candidatus Pacebacteria bacterium]|nr:serine hydroxymethyltransferase [Candidatus Paceibacterota bacterium]